MVPDPQLLTKQVIIEDLDATGGTVNVRFNLQRGKVARVWGFVWVVDGMVPGTANYSCFVRKIGGGERETTPQDNLWAWFMSASQNGINFLRAGENGSIMFPKPHRTTGITVQMHCTSTTTNNGLLIIYYDVDEATKGEIVQALEKNITKGRTRRTISP